MDQIRVQGIKVYANHGVLESEKTQGQWFAVDCDCFLDTSDCHDDLTRTVNYAQLSEEVVRFCQTTQFDLIETLTNELAQHLLLQYELMEDIVVTVHKPQAPITVPFSDVSITVKRGWKTCYLGIGSNLGDREQNLNLVSTEIKKDPKVRELAKSSYIETEPYGVTDQPRFLNGAMKIKTIYTPTQLLAFCKQI
jgi:dihydroneopterin aldolase/2-amino-4-hydroxy-6-hydroxymethyldihydropteridine diphosphokinase